MKRARSAMRIGSWVVGLGAVALAVAQATAAPRIFDWATVVNNNDVIPGATRNFNSYNQPSVNAAGIVVFRARSRGGPPQGPPDRGIFTRDMSLGDVAASPILIVASGNTPIPEPNNLGSTFIEFPSIPRIAIGENRVATRGNHQPVLQITLPDGSETRLGTTGIYVDLDTDAASENLLTGASKLGSLPEYDYFAVPGAPPGTVFDVFPGSPSITDAGTIAFKGNYTVTVGDTPVPKTGVFYRDLVDAPTGGTAPVQLIASSDTGIPDLPPSASGLSFGSTSPPSAAAGLMAFVGLDDEANPSFGGIYLAPLSQPPQLTTLVAIGSRVPGTGRGTFNRLGEGLSFDGRFVAFWGAWGDETRTLLLDCPTEGNRDRIEYCLEFVGDDFPVQVPVNQGIFLYDLVTGRTSLVARTGADFDDFVFWNFSGRVPDDEEDGEPARWRSSAFVAVSARSGATANVAFKARSGDLDPVEQNYVDFVDGIYLGKGPGQAQILTVLDTTMAGQDLDPEAPPASTISELGIEREALRGGWLVVNARMGEEGGEEEEGLAGIYVTRLP